MFYVEPGEPVPEPELSAHVSSLQIHHNIHNDLSDPNVTSLTSNGAKPKTTKKGIKTKVKTLVTQQKRTAVNGENRGNLKEEPRNNLRNGLTNGHSHGVTFNDRPTGMIKDVRLFVDPGRHNYGRRATLSERLFGIVTGQFSTRSELNGTAKDRRIMVQTLLPDGEALKSGEIKIGE